MRAGVAGLFGADVAMNASSESRYSALCLGLWGRGTMSMGTAGYLYNPAKRDIMA